MYHLWRGLPLGGATVAASDIGLPACGESDDRRDGQAQYLVDDRKEDGGQDDHDRHHDRGDPGFLTAGPVDLAPLGADLAEEPRGVEQSLEEAARLGGVGGDGGRRGHDRRGLGGAVADRLRAFSRFPGHAALQTLIWSGGRPALRFYIGWQEWR